MAAMERLRESCVQGQSPCRLGRTMAAECLPRWFSGPCNVMQRLLLQSTEKLSWMSHEVELAGLAGRDHTHW